jgi:hypothetical protein
VVVVVVVGTEVRSTDNVADGVDQSVDVAVGLGVEVIVGVTPVAVRPGVEVGCVGDEVGVRGFVFIDGPLLFNTILIAPVIPFTTDSIPATAT